MMRAVGRLNPDISCTCGPGRPEDRATSSGARRASRRHPAWPDARQRLDGERGAAIVEFAIVLPILVLLLFGIIEFSVAYNRAQAVHAAAREGARLGSLPETSVGSIKSRVNVAFAGVTFDGSPVITVSSNGGPALPNTATPCAPPALPNSTVEVNVTVSENIAIPLMGTRSVTLTGKGVFKCEV